jgi:hypothetical protein
MEEERLMLIKENKEMKDKNKGLAYEIEDYKGKLDLFERELTEVQEQVKNQALLSQKDEAYSSDNDTQISQPSISSSKNKENKSMNKKKPLTKAKPAVNVKKPAATLKF